MEEPAPDDPLGQQRYAKQLDADADLLFGLSQSLETKGRRRGDAELAEQVRRHAVDFAKSAARRRARADVLLSGGDP